MIFKLLACTLALISVAQAQTKESPLTPEEERASFVVPAGFAIDLVASDPDLAKVVDVSFDDMGRMWAVTAVEYPVDANETPGAGDIYNTEGRDRVLVFETPCASGVQKPRTFASGMVMPMSVLAIKDGVLVAQGSKIFLMRDSDSDGTADQRQVVLEGFGIQDSHLMPHRMIRGPGGWIYVMQGAFNSSRVVTKSGAIVPFDQCKVGRFKPDGSSFEVVGTGLNNIWGFVIDTRGQMWIQEANDLGYPVVPFHLGASYPGIGDHRDKPYSPWFPPLSRFEMGGTGLSGLALSEDANGFAAPYDGAMILANPIARSIQAIRVTEHDGVHDLEKLPDLVTTSDAWFRPIAIHYGPDGALYIVDWYNKIISHNEVPRTDPGRDKTHGRIWRLRNESQAPAAVADVEHAPDAKLLEHLRAKSTWEARAAWHQIADRQVSGLTPQLAEMVHEKNLSTRVRLLALWSLEGLGHALETIDTGLIADADVAIRREAIRARGEARSAAGGALTELHPLSKEIDATVRQAAIRAFDQVQVLAADDLGALLNLAQPALEIPTPNPEPRLRTNEVERQYLREFERSLIRSVLEKHRAQLEEFLASADGRAFGFESRALACLALEPDKAAAGLAEIVSNLTRPPSAEEIRILASASQMPEVKTCFEGLLANGTKRDMVLASLLAVSDRLQGLDLSAPIAKAVREELAAKNDEASRDRCVKIAAAFRVRELEPEIVAIARAATNAARRVACVRALTEIGSGDVALFRELAIGAVPGEELQRSCVVAIAESKDPRATAALVELWPTLASTLRKRALDTLTGSNEGAASLLAAIDADEILPSELDGEVLTRLSARFAGDARLAKLEQALSSRLRTVLRLEGGESALDTKLKISGPFTLEAWVNLDEGIDNRDAVLGAHGEVDFNFADRRFRMYAGKEIGDVIIASKQLSPDCWTHVAITRDGDGNLKLYWNGDVDPATCKPTKVELKDLDVGVAVAGGGTQGALCEVRLWDVARTPAEIGANFRRTFAGTKPAHLVFSAAGEGPWGKLAGGATLARTLDAPALQSEAAVAEQETKFTRYRALTNLRGNAERGRELFTSICMTCHRLRGEGAKVGPPLDGIGLRDTESLLRAVLTPSAAMESGYRLLRVETIEGELLDGMLASQDEHAIVLRRQSREDRSIERTQIRRMSFADFSVMPDGQLEALTPADVSSLFAYVATLR